MGADVTSGNAEIEAPGDEEGKPVSATDIQEEHREKGGQEKQGEGTVSIEEKPEEASEEQPAVTLDQPGTAVEGEAEPTDPTGKPVGVGGGEPREWGAASEHDPAKAVPEQLVGPEVPPAEESPEVATEAWRRRGPSL